MSSLPPATTRKNRKETNDVVHRLYDAHTLMTGERIGHDRVYLNLGINEGILKSMEDFCGHISNIKGDDRCKLLWGALEGQGHVFILFFDMVRIFRQFRQTSVENWRRFHEHMADGMSHDSVIYTYVHQLDGSVSSSEEDQLDEVLYAWDKYVFEDDDKEYDSEENPGMDLMEAVMEDQIRFNREVGLIEYMKLIEFLQEENEDIMKCFEEKLALDHKKGQHPRKPLSLYEIIETIGLG